jgi:NitT/TauT family transport system substrate-binding protein
MRPGTSADADTGETIVDSRRDPRATGEGELIMTMDRRTVLAGLASAGAVAALGRTGSTQSLETVNCGRLTGVSDAPFFIADAKGFFREAGVAVNWTTFPQSQAMVAPLAAGQLDAMGASVSAGIYNAIGRDVAVKIVGDRGIDYAPYGGLQLVVRTDLVKSGRFKALRDLKGLTIAEPGRGSQNVPILVRFLEQARLGYGDISHLFMPFPDQVAGLRNGTVDASVLIEPYATMSIKEGSSQRIAYDYEAYPNHQISALMFGQAFVQKRSSTAHKFFVGYLRGLRYYHDALRGGRLAGPTAPDVIAILQRAIALPDPSIWHAMSPSAVQTNGRADVASLSYDYHVYDELGLISNPTNPADAIDFTFADAANRELGRYVPAT